jgi:hypothetical protein
MALKSVIGRTKLSYDGVTEYEALISKLDELINC